MRADTRFFNPDTTNINEYPTYRDCNRCGIRLGIHTPHVDTDNHCMSCRSMLKRVPKHQSGFTIPTFDITVFRTALDPRIRTETTQTFKHARVAYNRMDTAEDNMALLYMLETIGHFVATLTTITIPGETLDWWEGDNPRKAQYWINRARAEAEAA